MSRNDLSIIVGHLSEKVTENLLYELFLQAGPVNNVNIPNHQGKQRSFGFVEFKHRCSVPYAMSLMEGVRLFGSVLKLATAKGSSNMQAMPPPLGVQVPHMYPQPMVHRPMDSRVFRMDRPISKGKEAFADDYDDGADLRNRLKPRARHADYLMPSNRSKRCDSPTKTDLDAIPDFLGSGFDPLYSSGIQHKPSHQLNRDSRRRGFDQSHRREPYDKWSGGSRGPNFDDPRHGRHSHKSNKRKYF